MSYISFNARETLKKYESEFNKSSFSDSNVVNSFSTLKTRLAEYDRALDSQAAGTISIAYGALHGAINVHHNAVKKAHPKNIDALTERLKKLGDDVTLAHSGVIKGIAACPYSGNKTNCTIFPNVKKETGTKGNKPITPIFSPKK